jgi:predicted dehydrogenase
VRHDADPHTVVFLNPGHFHAALTLRTPHPRLSDEVVVYAPEGPELRDFLALVERFNRRSTQPTRWQAVVVTSGDPLSRLVADRRGDLVVLAGRNAGKARTMRRLHEAGFHVLADKPWLVCPDDLDAVRASLPGWPLVMEIMTGRHDLASRLLKRLVDVPDVFGGFRDDAPTIELDSVHQLAKLVDGAPLRRPWWFFDVRVQGGGAVDIPTHLVDQTQWFLENPAAPDGMPELLSARAWATRVPRESFRWITGEPDFPSELTPFVDGEALSYAGNATLEYRIGDATARATARWELSRPPGGGDAHRLVAHGTRADIRLEQSVHTGYRRRLVIEPTREVRRVRHALNALVDAWQSELPGVCLASRQPDRYELAIPDALDDGHESHFARVLDDFLRAIDDRRLPATLAAGTLAKYALLAEAARVTASGCGTRGAGAPAP